MRSAAEYSASMYGIASSAKCAWSATNPAYATPARPGSRRADAPDLVLAVGRGAAVALVGRDVEGAVRSLDRAPESHAVLQDGRGPGDVAGAVEVHEAQLAPLQHRDRERAVERLPLRAGQERRAGRGDRAAVARAPDRAHRVRELRQVGHRHGLVVAGHGIPAAVASRHEAVDLVVAVGSVL